MSLAQGVKGSGRRSILYSHRLLKHMEYFNRFIDGDPKVTAEMVTERGRKLKAIGG
uniref:Uncharacterized protein n=1 Tax=viral metagenome TaxID=1070528 RepID=A0A6M3LHB3_9ZZZZ